MAESLVGMLPGEERDLTPSIWLVGKSENYYCIIYYILGTQVAKAKFKFVTSNFNHQKRQTLGGTA